MGKSEKAKQRREAIIVKKLYEIANTVIYTVIYLKSALSVSYYK